MQAQFEKVTNTMLQNHTINGSTTVLIYTSLLSNAVLVSNLNDSDSSKEWLQVVTVKKFLTSHMKARGMRQYMVLAQELVSIFTQYYKNYPKNDIPNAPLLGTSDYYEFLQQAQKVFLILYVSIYHFICE